MNNVRFVRIHGRVVPIRTDQAQERKKTIVRAAVATAAAAGTYLALRKFRLAKSLPLARLQVAAKKTGGVSFSSSIKGPMQKVQAAIYGSRVNAKGAGVVANTFTLAKKGKHTINSSALSTALDDKKHFGTIFKGSTPRTTTVQGASKLGAKRDVLFKPREGSLGKVEDFATRADIANKTDRGRRVLNNPKGYIAQEKLELTGEYRAHVLNGHVFGISHRRIPHAGARKLWGKFMGQGGGAFVPVTGAKRAEIHKFMTESVKKSGIVGALPHNESMFAAFDIGQTKHGLKLIEANSSPGTMANPIINRQFHRHVTGRWGKDVASAAALATGGAAFKVTKKAQNGRSGS